MDWDGIQRQFETIKSGGDEGARTLDLWLAKPALSQLSYIPISNSQLYALTVRDVFCPSNKNYTSK